MTIRRQPHAKNEYVVEINSDAAIATISGAREALPEIHRHFTFDPEAGNDGSSFLYMGFDALGNPQILEFCESVPDDFE